MTIKRLSEYHTSMRRTADVPGEEGVTPHRQMVWGLGIAGEAGEVCELLALTPFKDGLIIEELGDVLWYTAALAYSLGSSIDQLPEVEVHPAHTADLMLPVFAGKVADMIKKHHGHNKPYNREKLLAVLGGVLASIKQLAGIRSRTILDVANLNNEKLLDRYPRGFIPA